MGRKTRKEGKEEKGAAFIGGVSISNSAMLFLLGTIEAIVFLHQYDEPLKVKLKETMIVGTNRRGLSHTTHSDGSIRFIDLILVNMIDHKKKKEIKK